MLAGTLLAAEFSTEQVRVQFNDHFDEASNGQPDDTVDVNRLLDEAGKDRGIAHDGFNQTAGVDDISILYDKDINYSCYDSDFVEELNLNSANEYPFCCATVFIKNNSGAPIENIRVTVKSLVPVGETKKHAYGISDVVGESLVMNVPYDPQQDRPPEMAGAIIPPHEILKCDLIESYAAYFKVKTVSILPAGAVPGMNYFNHLYHRKTTGATIAKGKYRLTVQACSADGRRVEREFLIGQSKTGIMTVRVVSHSGEAR